MPRARPHALHLAALVAALHAAPARGGPADLVDEARYLFRVAACPSAPRAAPALPADVAALVVEHCRKLRPLLDAHRGAVRGQIRPFFAGVQPARLPRAVVYPFGGGDLLGALDVFPDADEITTLSLERVGDPRVARALRTSQLDDGLARLREALRGRVRGAYFLTQRLESLGRGPLPGQLLLALVALALHDLEPVALHLLAIDGGGRLRRLDAGDLARCAARADPACFAHMELVYAPRGRAAATRVHRHLAADLSDDGLRRDRTPLSHLAGKRGEVAAMVKAAGAFLWRDRFSRLRAYLAARPRWMVSDSSGIPVQHARAAGLVVTPYGDFDGAAFSRVPRRHERELRELWASNPRRALSFRFGYPDRRRRAHLLIFSRPR
jgi:hypothetical protein